MSVPEIPESCHVFSNDAMGRDDATTLADKIRRRELSITELTRAAIARAGAAEPLVHGIASDNDDDAIHSASILDAAEEPLSRPLFRGVPTYVKDNTNVAGLSTRHGSLAVPEATAADTSPFARQLLAQGFLCLGKSTLPEFGFNASTEPAHGPATRTPGTWLIHPVPPQAVQRPWSRPGSCPSPMLMTVEDLYAFRPLAAVWWASSPPGAGWWTTRQPLPCPSTLSAKA